MTAVAVALLVPAASAGAASAQTITTVAGNGSSGYTAGGPATAAKLNGPRGISWMPDGGFVFADFWNSRVRRVLPDGTIKTVAGTGVNGNSKENRQATTAKLNLVHDVAGLADGSFLIADNANYRIRKVTPDGVIHAAAGNGAKGFGGDGGGAINARLANPRGVAATGGGGFLIADSDNNRIRCVTPEGRINTVAGGGTTFGFSGDGGPATSARLSKPFAVSPTYDGGFVIADRNNSRVRKVSAAGIISTIGGNGDESAPDADGNPAPGDGGPATAAALSPWSVGAEPDGGVLVADSIQDRVRRIGKDGTITTAAGSGLKNSGGDGGAAPQGGLHGPRDVAVRPDGAFLVAEFGPDEQLDPGGDRARFVGSGPFNTFPLPAFNSTCSYKG